MDTPNRPARAFLVTTGLRTNEKGANKLQIFLQKTKKKFENRVILELFLVDDIGLEPMTFRTSSGCSSQLS